MCENAECGIHSRTNVSEINRPDPYMITYVGRWAVHTELIAEQGKPDPEFVQDLAEVIMSAMTGQDYVDEAQALLDRIPMRPAAIVYEVNNGCLADVLVGGTVDDRFVSRREYGPAAMTVPELHASMVDEYYDIP